MAIIVHRPNNHFSKIETGNTVHVQDDGSLVVRANSRDVAAFAKGSWIRAYLQGDHSETNADGTA